MDNILEACFNEDLFTTPLHHSKQKKEKKIESRNPWKYVDKLEPIYETHKVTKEELATLVAVYIDSLVMISIKWSEKTQKNTLDV